MHLLGFWAAAPGAWGEGTNSGRISSAGMGQIQDFYAVFYLGGNFPLLLCGHPESMGAYQGLNKGQ